MKKSSLLILVATAITWSCSRTETEIVVQLSEPEFLHSKYPSWFAADEGIDKESLNNELRVSIKGELASAKEEALNVLGKRIVSAADPVPFLAGLLNKAELTVTELPDPNTWSFKINRKVDPDKTAGLLTAKVDCGFWETYKLEEIWESILQANSAVKDAIASGELDIEPDTTETGLENPLFMLLRPMLNNDGQLIDGCEIGVSNIKDTAVVNKILSFPAVSMALPRNLKPMWSLKAYPGTMEYYALIAVKMSSFSGLPLMTNKNIVGASVNSDRYPPDVNIVMDAEGAQLWSRITADNINRNIAVTMNDAVCFYPRVSMQVEEGRTAISADFTEEEAKELSLLLGSGYMPPFGVGVISVK